MDRPELLAVLCRELPEFHEVAAMTGKTAALAAVLKAAREGEPIEELLRSAGLLSALDSGTSRSFPGSGDPGLVVALGGSTGGHVALGTFRCPAEICDRAERPGAVDDMPVCAVHRRALRFDPN
jgi:hypothetical protein